MADGGGATKARPGKRGAARASGSLTAWIWLRLVVVVVVRVRFGDEFGEEAGQGIYRAEVFSLGSSLEPGLKTL